MEFSLKEARERAKAARQKLADRIDPIDARRDERAKAKAAKAKALTFAQAAQQYHEQHEAEWSNKKHRDQFLRSLMTYAYPIIGDLDVATVGMPEVLKVLEQKVPEAIKGNPAGVFWQVRTTTANRVRNRIELVLDWAVVRGHRPQGVPNPARWQGNLSEALPKPGKVAPVVNHRAVPYKEMPELMAQLATHEGVGVKALQFAILTAARRGEVLGARWDEIDFDAAMWTVPAERMKGRREHRVPLARHVVELLKGLYTEDGTPYVFVGPRTGAQLSETALAEALRRAGRTRDGARAALLVLRLGAREPGLLEPRDRVELGPYHRQRSREGVPARRHARPPPQADGSVGEILHQPTGRRDMVVCTRSSRKSLSGFETAQGACYIGGPCLAALV